MVRVVLVALVLTNDDMIGFVWGGFSYTWRWLYRKEFAFLLLLYYFLFYIWGAVGWHRLVWRI